MSGSVWDEVPGTEHAVVVRTYIERWPRKDRAPEKVLVIVELLCNGHHPFPNAMPKSDESVIDPRTIRFDLGPDLAEFLIKACAPARADRFSTAAEMRLALRSIRAGI